METNYGGKVANNSAYIKHFTYETPLALRKTCSQTLKPGSTVNVITAATNKYTDFYIKGDLYVDGSIINLSDAYLQTNIDIIDSNITNKILNLNAIKYTVEEEPTPKTHYGFIVQDIEKEYPELVSVKPDEEQLKNIKAINYLEIIPLLVSKIQMLQKEIDELKNKI